MELVRALRSPLVTALFAVWASRLDRCRSRLPPPLGCDLELAVVGLGCGAVGVPVDPYYGSLLAEPVGYPDAIGVLIAMGVVLAIGLAGAGRRGAERSRPSVAAGSRARPVGARAARFRSSGLGAGGAPSSRRPGAGHGREGGVGARGRRRGVGARLSRLGVGGPLVIAAVAAVAIGAAVPTFARRGAIASATASFWPSRGRRGRATLDDVELPAAYWVAALTRRARPLLGSGAGAALPLVAGAPDGRDGRPRRAQPLRRGSRMLGPLGLARARPGRRRPLGAAVRRRRNPVGGRGASPSLCTRGSTGTGDARRDDRRTRVRGSRARRGGRRPSAREDEMTHSRSTRRPWRDVVALLLATVLSVGSRVRRARRRPAGALRTRCQYGPYGPYGGSCLASPSLIPRPVLADDWIVPVHRRPTLTGGANPGGTLTFRLYGPGDSGCASAVVRVHGRGDGGTRLLLDQWELDGLGSATSGGRGSGCLVLG